MKIGIYAGSIRPGGGLTVLQLVIKALAAGLNNKIIVYVGADDTSASLRPLLEDLDNVTEIRFLPNSSAQARYLASKLFFLKESTSKKIDWLFSFNYFVPARCPVAVYHINLLSFQSGSVDSLDMKVKRFDARLACRFASLNVFESKYLLAVAEQRMKARVRSPALLYIGADQDFYSEETVNNSDESNVNRFNLLLVSSVQEHKDNATCLRTLQLLCEKRPQIPWKLTVAGGQGISQWDEVKQQACDLGIDERIEFIGPVDKKHLSQLMRRSLCLINSSKVESFCMVAIEAMAASCPVIVTDATSMPESVGGAGIVVKPGSEEDFCTSVLNLYDDEKLRQEYIKKGTRRAEDFTVESFGRNLRNLLQPI